MQRPKNLTFIIQLLMMTLFSSIVSAFEVTPMSATITAGQNNNEMKLTIENDSDEMTAIEISVVQRDVDELGQENLPETENFYVYPPQLILKPYEKRAIKVKWTGKQTPDIEEAYRVIVEQLPIELEKRTTSGITLLFKYETALYFDPGNTESDLSINNLTVKGNDISFMMVNDGSKHQPLADYQLKIRGTGVSGNPIEKVLTDEQTRTLRTKNVLAKKRLRHTLTLPAGTLSEFKQVSAIQLQPK